MKTKYTKQLAEDMETKGVALTESGAYVRRSFEADELERAVQAAKACLDYENESRFVMVHGRGNLVRQGRPSKDGTAVKFNKGIVTMELIKGEVLCESELAQRVHGLPGIKVMDLNKGQTRVGIILGSVDEPYATLVDVYQGKLRIQDIETKEHANNKHILMKVMPMTAMDEAVLISTRENVKQIMERQ